MLESLVLRRHSKRGRIQVPTLLTWLAGCGIGIFDWRPGGWTSRSRPSNHHQWTAIPVTVETMQRQATTGILMSGSIERYIGFSAP